MEYQVDAKEERSPSENFIYITTVLSNSQVVSDYNRRIQDGEIFQTYFSMKDEAKEEKMTVILPAPTEKLEITEMEQEIDVPFYENFVCSLVFD